jgi:serine protease Do
MKNKKVLSIAVLAAAGIIFCAVLVSGFGLVKPSYANFQLGASHPPVSLDADANSFSKAFIEVAEKVTPTIVQITVVSERKDDPQSDFFFFPFKDLPKEQKGSGSGIIISDDGYIVTNNHVVENATKIEVNLYDKRNFSGKVVGRDPLTDLAVIKIDAKGLPVAYLGDSDGLKVGQWVMAIGNPLSLTSTVTAGIVSAIGRSKLGLIKDTYGVENFIQTDAVINPGNSGGALVDLSGAVVGINSAIACSGTGTYIGYGFAIPINLAKSVAKDLIEHGKVSRGYIGINIGDVDADLAKSLGLDKPKGVIVQGLVKDGAAAKADIKEMDVILKVDGREVDAPNELQSMIASKSAGTVVTLTIWRDGKEMERKVTLKARDNDEKTELASNDEEKDSEKDSKSSTLAFDEIGLTVSNMTSADKKSYNVEAGVKITDVKPYSKADDKSLAPNFVIVEAGKKKIKNVHDLKKAIDEKRGSAVLLKVQDIKGNSRYIAVDVPKK